MHRFFLTELDNLTDKQNGASIVDFEDVTGENVSQIVIKTPETLHHMVRSLRMTVGETCEIISDGLVFISQVDEILDECINLSIIRLVETTYESPIEITLFQCLPKGQKMELIVQKNVELGVNHFYLVNAKRCVADYKHKDFEKKRVRFNKIANEAAKQSKRTQIPEVIDLIALKALKNMAENYDLLLALYEDEHQQTLKSLIKDTEYKRIGIIVGPEGGFATEEILFLKEIGFKVVTLGNRILRTETAGFTAVACLQYELGDLS
jgi:16S rRNA (uracil1498-N3)-methyltransferase